MRKSALWLGVSLVAASLFAGWLWHRNSVSDQFRQTVVALVDPTSRKDDVHAYLREARLRAHTDKEKVLLGKAERAVYFDDEADRLSESNSAALMSLAKDPYHFSKTFYRELDSVKATHRAASSEEIARLDQLKREARDARIERFKQIHDSIAQQKECSENSLHLFDELRSDVGAPGQGRYVANMAPTYEVLFGIQTQNDNIQKVPEDFMDRMEAEVIPGAKAASARKGLANR